MVPREQMDGWILGRGLAMLAAGEPLIGFPQWWVDRVSRFWRVSDAWPDGRSHDDGRWSMACERKMGMAARTVPKVGRVLERRRPVSLPEPTVSL